MAIGQQNAFNQQLSLTPGRVITKVKRYTSPSGKVVELRWVTITVQDDQGIWRTEESIEAVPPLDDGSVLNEDNYGKLCECTICRSITVQGHQCPRCCQLTCMVCTDKLTLQDKVIRACVNCVWEVKHPGLSMLQKIVWG